MAKREYSSEDLTVTWDSAICVHSQICWKGLPDVFNPAKRPWVDVGGAEDDAIAQQVDACPSGALGYRRHGGTPTAASDDSPAGTTSRPSTTIQPTQDGPYQISGPIELLDRDGNRIRDFEKLFLCRCGHSNTKPFCDGSHKEVGFTDS